jgi:hypothetical protein
MDTHRLIRSAQAIGTGTRGLVRVAPAAMPGASVAPNTD